MKKFYLAIVIILLVVLGFWALIRQTGVPEGSLDSSLKTRESDWVKGNTEAAVTLTEYVDFQCPACGAYFPLVKLLEEEYGDRVKFIVRHFPLTSIHPNAMPAAIAAEAAGAQGKFWEMHDFLLGKQKEWSSARTPEEIFASYAEIIGAERDKFLSDYRSNPFKDKIAGDINFALMDGAQGTPTFILNGKKIKNPGGEEFKTLIEDELKK